MAVEDIIGSPLPPDPTAYPSGITYQTYHIPLWTIYKEMLPTKTEADFGADLLAFDNSNGSVAVLNDDGTIEVLDPGYGNFDNTDSSQCQDPQWQGIWMSYLMHTYPTEIEFIYQQSEVSNNTLLSMLQMDFVVNTNKRITQEMEDLYKASDLTTQITAGLNAVNNYYNAKNETVSAELTFDEVDTSIAGQQENYVTGAEITKDSLLDDTDFAKVFGSERTYRLNLNHLVIDPDESEILSTARLRFDATDTVVSLNLLEYLTVLRDETQLISNSLENIASPEDSLAGTLTAVIDGLVTYRDNGTWQTDWPYDHNVGRDIQTAMASTDHLSSTSETSLRRAMWNFEEFYKIAAKILSKLRNLFSQLTRRIT